MYGLGLALTVTAQDHSQHDDDPRHIHGQTWDIRISPTGQPAQPADSPGWPTLEHAIAWTLANLDHTTATTVPTDPDQPIPMPSAVANPLAVDPAPLIQQLARHHPDQPVALHFDQHHCQLHLPETALPAGGSPDDHPDGSEDDYGDGCPGCSPVEADAASLSRDRGEAR